MTFDDFLLKNGIDRKNPYTDVTRVPELHRAYLLTNANQ